MIIGVFNQKGGVAKTTTTSNLGSAITMKGKKVLVVDMDPQANCTNALGVDDETLEQSIYDLLISQQKPNKERILEVVKRTSFEVDLLPSDISLADAEQTLSNVISRETVLKKLLDQVRNDYDYILVDCPPSLGLLSINALAASDYIIIPVYPSYFSVKGIKHLLKTCSVVKDNLNQKLDIMGIVLTKFDKRITKHKEIKWDLEKLQVFKNKVFKTVIRVNSELEYAQDEQKPITFYNTSCNGYIDYTNLADEVVNHEDRK
jgi:chromosome partitioning protein